MGFQAGPRVPERHAVQDAEKRTPRTAVATKVMPFFQNHAFHHPQYKVRICTTRCDFVLQAKTLYYELRFCAMRYHFVLHGAALYHKVRVCTSRDDSVLHGTILYYKGLLICKVPNPPRDTLKLQKQNAETHCGFGHFCLLA